MIRLTSEYGNFRPSSFIFMSTFVPNSNNIRMEHFHVYFTFEAAVRCSLKKRKLTIDRFSNTNMTTVRGIHDNFWRPLVFSTRKSNLSGNAVTSIYSSKSIQGRRSTVEKTSRCKSKKGTSPNLLQTHYVLIHVFFNDTWAVFYRIPKLWTPFIFLKRK